MGTKKKDAGYHAAVTGARGILKTLIYICLLLLLVFAGKTAYDFGYDIFVQQPVASEENGQDITVEVTENMGVREIGADREWADRRKPECFPGTGCVFRI